jgi:hypothetical protein
LGSIARNQRAVEVVRARARMTWIDARALVQIVNNSADIEFE